ncbi:alkylglycerol monooxygenase-like [Chrysoperla carnea]|uniref:alkylglycerol monooxygenase-like n=1 Tax=Chrysoperla carnea TaxID=189513 RepID=UPI001D0932A6|nr:alkylglycerol monooxygenase-like [Chrysoperla carnea]
MALLNSVHDNYSTIVETNLKGFGQFIYFVDPNKYHFKSTYHVPEIFQQAWPYFLTLVLVENIIRYFEKRSTVRVNDTITSFSHGLFQECFRLLLRGSESALYIYIYDKYRLVDLPWESTLTWYVAALAVDFCYYWVHRCCHEVHILWAQHQVHHSSEDFNLTVGLRQSFLQNALGSFFYLPMAFFISPALYLTHHQFNLLFQFWVHTEVIKSIGPLEYIFNCPKHHRVHHGSNVYCLDKNYGGVLIIWDRIFGTFAEEQDGVQIVYGLVVQQPSFNPLFLQYFYTQYVFEKAQSMENWKHKLAAIFWGPSWEPGKPRLGCDADKIDVTSRTKYDVKIPQWCNVYLVCHFVIIVLEFQELASRHTSLNSIVVLGFVLYIILSLTIIGMLFDNHPYAGILEFIRCITIVIIMQRKPELSLIGDFIPVIQSFFILSSLFWALHTFKIIQIHNKCKAL